VLAQTWLVQLAAYGREEGEPVTHMRAFYPHFQAALQLDNAAWLAIERMLDWWLEHWQILHEGQLGKLYQVQQIVHGAIYLEEAGHVGSAVEWVEWWLKVWRHFLLQDGCGAGHEMAAFLDKSAQDVVQLAKGSIVYAPHRLAAWQIMVFWRQALASGLVRPSEKYRVVGLYLTYFGQAVLGKQWSRAARGLLNAVRFSYQPKAWAAWVEFFQFGLRYWRNGRLEKRAVS
ncbi:MAG: hypothetical protein KC449_23155, partial [Anaerolineales bacterium]|nr:hypothetical protein [Anaerolineales bacterium]